MSEIGETWKAVRQIIREESAALRVASVLVFEEARELAKSHGLDLRQHSDSHYSLRKDGWQIDIYPGNQRVHRPRNCPAPFIDFGDASVEWTILDAVKGAVKQ